MTDHTPPHPAPDSTVSLTSAKQMRALAHPLRLEVLGELRVNGPRTVGMLSAVFDEAPGTLSYHLGKLAEFGFVEEAPGLSTDRRERWWRAAHEFTHLDPGDPDAAPAERRAATVVWHQIIDGYAATLHRAADLDAQLSREWVQAQNSSDTIAFLTATELAAAAADLDAVLEKWHARGDRTRPDTEAVLLIAHALRRPS